MKTIKYITAIALLSASLAACTNNSRDSATLGNTQDTGNVAAGTNAAGEVSSSSDTSNNGNYMRGDSSTSNGNANPSGHVEGDTTNMNRNGTRRSHQ